MNTSYLVLGSNLGNKLHNLQQAIYYIGKEIGPIVKASDIFITAAWGKTAQPDFVNQALCINTNLSPQDLLHKILRIEKKIGRVRDQQRWKERIIDIDILFFNDAIINTSNLTIPHPYIHERKFVLIPLLEIAPELTHPVFNKSLKVLLQDCMDLLEVKRIES